VNRWIFRGAVGTIFYGISLMALGVTLVGHMAGLRFSFAVELFESLAMAFSKLAVARAALMVHRHLTPVAYGVTGPWVLVVGILKLIMAFVAFCGGLVFGAMADSDYENVCFAMYLFRWSLLLALPLQCLAGFALWRIQLRAMRYAGGSSRVFIWASLLVLGNFGSGLCVWWAGYLGTVHEASLAFATSFGMASMSQLVAGVSLLVVNRKVKQHFKQQADCNNEVVTPTFIGQPVAEQAGI